MTGTRRPCPFCAEEIAAEAVRCPHCRSRLVALDPSAWHREHPERKVAGVAAALAHATHHPSFEIEAEMLVSELSRETGDVQGALAASDRALAASNPKVNPSVPARVRADVLRTRGVSLT